MEKFQIAELKDIKTAGQAAAAFKACFGTGAPAEKRKEAPLYFDKYAQLAQPGASIEDPRIAEKFAYQVGEKLKDGDDIHTLLDKGSMRKGKKKDMRAAIEACVLAKRAGKPVQAFQ